MHILFLSDNFPPERNAAATRVYERACYWVKWGYKVTVLTCAPNFPDGEVYEGYKNKWYQVEDMDGIRVVRVKTFMHSNSGFLLRILDFLSYMFMAFFVGLFQKKPDIIVATSPQFFSAVGGYLLAVMRRKPFVFELSDLWPASIIAVGAMKPSIFLRIMEKVELFLYRRSAVVVALTYAFKDDLVKRGIAADKIKVIRNGVDLSRYKPVAKDNELLQQYNLQDKFIVGYIGTHGMAQGLGNVLAAAERLQQYDNIRFMFVGGGAEREQLCKQAAGKKLNNILFVPLQPKESVPGFWGLCDIALVHLKNNPVFETVIPSKIFEAMGMGLPIMLVAPSGEARTVLESAEAGVWVPAGDPDALAAAVVQLVADTQKLRTFAENSYTSAPKHSREKQAHDMLQVFQDIVA